MEELTPMASGTLLDLNTPTDSAFGQSGPRPLLSRGQLIALRVLVGIYVLTFALLAAANVPFVGHVVFGLISRHLAARFVLGLMVSATGLTFFLLLALCLYHFLRGHVGPQPARWWLWVIVFLNVGGVVLYYVWVIEPEHRGSHHLEGAT